jgi:tyrosyl-tRNA synthetase
VKRALAASAVMFGGSLDNLRDADLEPLLADVPSSSMPKDELAAGVALLELLTRTQLADSKGAARRLVQGGGVYLNNLRVTDPTRTVRTEDLGTETMLVLRSGKKSYHIVRVID